MIYTMEKTADNSKDAVRNSEKTGSFQKLDWILLLVIMILYSVFALYDLGYQYAPSTAYDMQAGDNIELQFEENAVPTYMYYYTAPKEILVSYLQIKTMKGAQWREKGEIALTDMFTWRNVMFDNMSNQVQLTLSDAEVSILELVFVDAYGNMLVPVNAADYGALFDEYWMIPSRTTFRDSMYFDEIYHARAAYEYINGMVPFENTHPPLGKIFISLGVLIFGMNPFGWRIVGTLFGIAMLPVIYLFAKQITKHTPTAALACLAFAFDFMHFTQTRIATIDVYVTFFVILMYYFMYRYICMSHNDSNWKKSLIPLGLCGISMGLGIACKWTGVYAGVGLAVLFFGNLYQQYRKHQMAKSDADFSVHTRKTIGFCMVFFVLIPVMIYALSYIPFVDEESTGFFDKIISNQELMFGYHSNLETTHPYSSKWYEWPTMVRPVWYYSGIISETLREGISAFGNPAVWWLGIPATVYMVYLMFWKKDRTATFLLIGYLAQYLPWSLISRATFAYHYFPSVPFVVLMIIYSIVQLREHTKPRTYHMILLLYGVLVFGLFIHFYPVLSGQTIEAEYVREYLRWFDGWALVQN